MKTAAMDTLDKSGMGHRTVSGLLWMATGKGAQALLQLLVLTILARLLLPVDFGVVSAAMVIIGFSEIFSRLGMGPAIVQRQELNPSHLQTAFAVSLVFSLIVAGIIWTTAPVVSTFFKIAGVESVLKTLAWIFPIKGLSIVAESLMLRELRFSLLAKLEVASFAVGYGVIGVIAALWGLGAWSLVSATLTTAILKTGILLAKYPPPRRPLPQRRAFKELMYFGGGFTIARVTNQLAVQGDNLIVGRCLGPAALGLYGRAYQLMSMPAALIGQVLDDVLFPSMAKLQNDKQRLEAAYRRSVSLVALIMLPASMIGFVLAPELVHVILGNHWAEGVSPFRILIIGLLFRTSYKISDSMARSTGAVYRRAWRQAIYASLVIGGAWVGQHWGLAGVATGVLAALTVNFLLMAQLSLKLTGMRWWSFVRAHSCALFSVIILSPIVVTFTEALRQWSFPPLALVILTASVALVSLILLMRYAPRLFLGRDGLWMLEILSAFLPTPLRIRFVQQTGLRDLQLLEANGVNVGSVTTTN